jgi:mannose-6-phosphate isomerase-like protein (cupin superfamily)
MATKAVLKLTQVHGVVKVRGTGSATIALATDLKKASETQSSPRANIRAIHWALSVGSTATVTRNDEILYYLSGTGKMEFFGWSDGEQNTSDIVVDFSSGTGAVVLELSKISGYGPQQHQNQGDLG